VILNDELESIQKKTIMAYFKIYIAHYFPGETINFINWVTIAGLRDENRIRDLQNTRATVRRLVWVILFAITVSRPAPWPSSLLSSPYRGLPPSVGLQWPERGVHGALPSVPYTPLFHGASAQRQHDSVT
jgi:hypothetical protein